LYVFQELYTAQVAHWFFFYYLLEGGNEYLFFVEIMKYNHLFITFYNIMHFCIDDLWTYSGPTFLKVLKKELKYFTENERIVCWTNIDCNANENKNISQWLRHRWHTIWVGNLKTILFHLYTHIKIDCLNYNKYIIIINTTITNRVVTWIFIYMVLKFRGMFVSRNSCFTM